LVPSNGPRAPGYCRPAARLSWRGNGGFESGLHNRKYSLAIVARKSFRGVALQNDPDNFWSYDKFVCAISRRHRRASARSGLGSRLIEGSLARAIADDLALTRDPAGFIRCVDTSVANFQAANP
jgi:hypothetical protein